MYMPYRQVPYLAAFGAITFYLRTNLPPAPFAETVRSTVSGIDRDLPLFDVKTLNEQMSEAMSRERHFFCCLVSGAAFALLLACIGMYGTVSFSFSRRIREIGIRLTLGASRRDILKSALRELDMVVVGVVLGLGRRMDCDPMARRAALRAHRNRSSHLDHGRIIDDVGGGTRHISSGAPRDPCRPSRDPSVRMIASWGASLTMPGCMGVE